MVADPARDRLELADRAEIERAAPHERVDGVEEIAPERLVAATTRARMKAARSQGSALDS
jgi:hypothetical protein